METQHDMLVQPSSTLLQYNHEALNFDCTVQQHGLVIDCTEEDVWAAGRARGGVQEPASWLHACLWS